MRRRRERLTGLTRRDNVSLFITVLWMRGVNKVLLNLVASRICIGNVKNAGQELRAHESSNAERPLLIVPPSPALPKMDFQRAAA